MAKILLVVYDNTSYIPFFPQGIAYLGSALKQAGHEVDYWLQDVWHWPDEALTQVLDRIHYDIVGLGFVAGYYQHNKAIALSEAVNRSVNRGKFTFVLGGHGPAGAPEYFPNKLGADLVIVGEGEVWAQGDLTKDEPHLAPWIRYVRPLENLEDFHPDYKSFPMGAYRLMRWPTSKRTDFCMPILTGRG